jgi:RHS repeat-associated protein
MKYLLTAIMTFKKTKKMKFLWIISFLFIAYFHAKAQINFNDPRINDQNYIYSKTREIGAIIDSLETIQYFDGFGRLIQTVNYKASPFLKDYALPKEYDQYGLEVIKYLPYEANSADGSYRLESMWKTAQPEFYKSLYGPGDGIKAYAQTKYDNSPLNRVMKQGAPGSSWQPDMTKTTRSTSEHVVSYEYLPMGSTVVYYWTVSGVYPNVSFTRKIFVYNALLKTNTYDENNNRNTEYRDKQGNIIFKSNTIGQTYYIYDDFGLLRCVLPPLATQILKDSSSFKTQGNNFNELCYYYEYDGRKRMIKKKLPGTIGCYTMKYDDKDRLTSTTDPNGTTDSTTYDIFSRPVQTTNKTTNQWLTKTYYDSYTKNGYDKVVKLQYVSKHSENTKVNNVKGKVTVTVAKILNKLGTIDSLRTVIYYDKYGRIIQTVSENQLGGINRISYRYKFKNSDLVAEKLTEHGKTEALISQYFNEVYTYDRTGRLLKTTHQLNGGTVYTISTMSYDKAGKLNSKMISNQSMVYNYNIRGWLIQINTPTTYINTNLFNLLLDYTGQYNGNIYHLAWNRGDDTIKHYYFTYDALDRVRSATYYVYKNGSSLTGETNKYYETYTYDANGNILTAKRNCVLYDGAPHIGLMDNLTYVYFNSGRSNRLYAVGDAAPDVANRGDFFDATDGSSVQEYYYNNNGNMMQDKNKHSYSLQLTYNYLNLIEKASVYSNYTNYSYTATGEKLGYKTLATNGAKVEYVGPFVYKNDVLEYIITSEGRIVFIGGSNYYEYYIKDHLGNIRVVFRKNASGNTVVLQKDDYYPGGLLIKERIDTATNKNKYLYNSKEFQTDLNLNYYDYGARMYDPQLGRWHVIDAMSESHYNYTPYNYCFNNPILLIDPFGNDSTTNKEWIGADNMTNDQWLNMSRFPWIAECNSQQYKEEQRNNYVEEEESETDNNKEKSQIDIDNDNFLDVGLYGYFDAMITNSTNYGLGKFSIPIIGYSFNTKKGNKISPTSTYGALDFKYFEIRGYPWKGKNFTGEDASFRVLAPMFFGAARAGFFSIKVSLDMDMSYSTNMIGYSGFRFQLKATAIMPYMTKLGGEINLGYRVPIKDMLFQKGWNVLYTYY